jgi:ubiquinone/menaquinone biosynthesis C-methylase UbiE
VRREFSESQPELMDLPHQDEEALRQDLIQLSGLNRTFGARRAVTALFHKLTGGMKEIVLIDLASGYGDHGRNLIARARTRDQDLTILALDYQFKTLQIARRATPPGQKMFFIQADARQLPIRSHGADFALCSLALHHFSEEDAHTVLQEMKRAGRLGYVCVDLVRSRLAAFGIALLTTFIVRDPMVRHDARLSIRRAFTAAEMKNLARRVGWTGLRQIKFFWFQQAILGRTVAPENGSL